MAHVQIVYGSNGGNTQLVCEYITAALEELGHQISLDRCEHFNIEALLNNDCLILACPTYEHGELEPNFLKLFWPRLQHLDLAQHPCCVVGLGDVKYDLDHHLQSARILQDYIESHKGQLLHQNLLVSGKPLPILNTMVQRWCERLHAKLTDL